MESCVNGINHVLESGTPDELMTYLLKPEALLPRVDPSRPYLYFDNLKKARVDKAQVYRILHSLNLSSVSVLNMFLPRNLSCESFPFLSVNNLFMIFSSILLHSKEISYLQSLGK